MIDTYYSAALDVNLLCNQPENTVFIKQGRKETEYLLYYCGFDIETTNIIDGDEKLAFMYHWQFGLNEHNIYGRTWADFIQFLTRIQKALELHTKRRLIIWIANEGFEFQFMRRHLNVTHVFARAKREPLLVEHNNCIEFRDCLPISGGGLDYLAKHYTSVRKAKGDLNFNIRRNSQTPLNPTELNYCRMDVRPLVEWAKYIFDTYAKKEGYIPMTKTGILRHIIKARVTPEIKSFIARNFPSKALYDIMMKWLFRGGYTHSNMWWTNCTIEEKDNLNGFDFTSSYPAVMQQYNKFPMSKLKLIPTIKTLDDLEKIPPKCPYFIAVRFTNIEATTRHSIESSFKCFRLEGRQIDKDGNMKGVPLIDNGRVFQAGIMSVMLTDLDLKVYEMFYKWEKAEVYACYYAAGGYLPKYLREPLKDLYQTKARLKKAGLDETTEYIESKKAINAGFGLCVTRLYLEEILYSQGRLNDEGILEEWCEVEKTRSWYGIVKGQFLLPQWGIWVTSAARFRLLSTVYAIEKESPEGGDVVYCDTDSIYMVNYEKHLHIIEEYNRDIYAVNDELFPNMPEFRDLGEFDLINKSAHCYWQFKTLGAKRYIKTQKLIINNRVYNRAGKTTVTIAGLPKDSLQKYCKERKKDIYKVFTEGMELNELYAHKNAHKYNDEPTSYNVEGEEMHELSSVCIYPTTFKLTWAGVYKSLLEEIAERKKAVEKYIH